ncbi:hypothetical protein Nepgr_013447 [Nepenthes gracilis]|uniref:Uncharacterized protein n=1 Tax=Nepenthes gracilis TaxID=150966 RepID=A0AAD3SJR4_NEPGR|nr:hypothetical protein Nepgr_013447 [Nepenthes gracilis]
MSSVPLAMMVAAVLWVLLFCLVRWTCWVVAASGWIPIFNSLYSRYCSWNLMLVENCYCRLCVVQFSVLTLPSYGLTWCGWCVLRALSGGGWLCPSLMLLSRAGAVGPSARHLVLLLLQLSWWNSLLLRVTAPDSQIVVCWSGSAEMQGSSDDFAGADFVIGVGSWPCPGGVFADGSAASWLLRPGGFSGVAAGCVLGELRLGMEVVWCWISFEVVNAGDATPAVFTCFDLISIYTFHLSRPLLLE